MKKFGSREIGQITLQRVNGHRQWQTTCQTDATDESNKTLYVIITVCLKAGLITSSWNWLSHLAIWGSIGVWFVFVILWSNVWPTLNIASVMVGQDRLLFSSNLFWLGILVTPLAPLILDITIVALKKTVFKNLTDQIRESEINKKDTSQIVPAESTTTLGETARLLRSVKCALTRRGTAVTELELSHGFAFSQEEGGAVTQSQMIRAYNTTLPKPIGM